MFVNGQLALDLGGVHGDIDRTILLNADGTVDFADMLLVLSNWGDCAAPPTACLADIDGNGTVGFEDLLEVLSSWS